MVLCRPHRNIEQPRQQNIIGVGQFAITHKLNNAVVRKLPSDKSYIDSSGAVEVEGHVYGHLGRHKRIARCLDWGSDFIDLGYESCGDLESYLKKVQVSGRVRCRMARQAVEAVVFTHSKNVIHSDLSARQYLLGKGRNNVRLSDFGGSSLQGSEALVMKNATHFLPRDEELPNSVQSDLFALGSTLYEIFLGRRPYEGVQDEEVQRLYSAKEFLALSEIAYPQWRIVIQKCWTCEYKHASDILNDIASVSCVSRLFKSLAYG